MKKIFLFILFLTFYPLYAENIEKISVVELSYFNAAIIKNLVDISWATASEANSKSFILERKLQSEEDFIAIDTLAAAGNSASEIKYSTIDSTITGANFYQYRLQLVDLDGTTTATSAISIYAPAGYVDLEYFKGEQVDTTVHLTWKTKTEFNVKAFVIEGIKLSNNIMISLDTVVAKGGLNIEEDYVLKKNNIKSSGIYIYKIYAIFNNDDFTKDLGSVNIDFEIKTGLPVTESNSIEIYNTNNSLIINSKEQISNSIICLYDLNGCLIISKVIDYLSGWSEYILDLPKLSNGVYFYTIKYIQGAKTGKLIFN